MSRGPVVIPRKIPPKCNWGPEPPFCVQIATALAGTSQP